MQSLTRQALRALEIYADPDWAPQGYAALADAARSRARGRRAGLGPPARLGARPARLGPHRRARRATSAACSTATTVIEGLAVDDDLRWSMLHDPRRARRGRRRGHRRPSSTATRPRPGVATRPRRGRCARPRRPRPRPGGSPSTTTRCPTRCRRPSSPASRTRRRASSSTPYVEKYFEAIPDVWARRTSELAQNVVIGLFPTWVSTIEQSTVERADAFLAGDGRAPLAAPAGQRGARRRRPGAALARPTAPPPAPTAGRRVQTSTAVDPGRRAASTAGVRRGHIRRTKPDIRPLRGLRVASNVNLTLPAGTSVVGHVTVTTLAGAPHHDVPPDHDRPAPVATAHLRVRTAPSTTTTTSRAPGSRLRAALFRDPRGAAARSPRSVSAARCSSSPHRHPRRRGAQVRQRPPGRGDHDHAAHDAAAAADRPSRPVPRPLPPARKTLSQQARARREAGARDPGASSAGWRPTASRTSR